MTLINDVSLSPDGRPASLGARVMGLLDDFARHTDEPGRLTRFFLSSAHRRAADELIGWMTKAGMTAWLDAAANVVGRYEGLTPDAPAVLIASHIDTVRDAGRYDGNLGVLAGLVCVEELARQGRRFPFAIEVVAFGDEEGVRFPSTLTGSRAVAGSYDPSALMGCDKNGITLNDALREFGGDPEGVTTMARQPQDILAYLELHIEQGPVLEANDLPVGVVTAISGATRLMVEVNGVPGHAGTVPMELRSDALTAAAEMMLAIEGYALSNRDVVATVGQLDVHPGAVNVIPSSVSFTIDTRSPVDETRKRAVADLLGEMESIARRRGVELNSDIGHDAPSSACHPSIIDALSQGVARFGVKPLKIPSGAGHDAMVFGGFCPMGMLFVRCAGGISHSPAETITTEDADIAVRVLLEFLSNLDPETLRS